MSHNLPCWEQWPKINAWNLIRQPGLHFHLRYWIWIAFQPLCKPLSCSVQKGVYFIVSSTCVEESAKKNEVKRKICLVLNFGGGKWKKKSNFRCLSEHGLWGTGLGEQRTIRWNCAASSQNINHLADADIEFSYGDVSLWGCQRELFFFWRSVWKKLQWLMLLGWLQSRTSNSPGEREAEGRKVPVGGADEGT